MSGSVTYMRSESRPDGSRDSTIPRFHTESVQDHVASAKEGRPIFFDQERVQLINPGNPSSPVELVTDFHRQKWPEQWAAFKRGSESTVDGTPLEQWSYLKRGNVLELKALNIFSIEQCAALTDQAVQKIGMGGHNIRDMARSWLDEADQMKITSAALAERDAANARMASMELELTELRSLTNQIHRELMDQKNLTPAVERHIPAEHDPISLARPVYSTEPVAESSLASLAPRRGRPPGSKNRSEDAA